MESRRYQKASAIIAAHIGSKRLPFKTIYPLRGKSVLWHVLERIKSAKTIDKVIVTLPEFPEDDVIEAICKECGVEVMRQNDFREGRKDLLNSVYECAKIYGVKHIVRVTDDCPLLDPLVVDLVVNSYFETSYDYVTNTIDYTWPEGLDVEVFSFELLELSAKEAKLDSEREHITRYIRTRQDIPKLNVRTGKSYPIYKCSIDNYEDWKFVNAIYTGIGRDLFGIDKIDEFLKTHPDISSINKDSIINEEAKRLDQNEQRSSALG